MRAHLHTLGLGHAHRLHHQRRIAGVEPAGYVGDVDDLEELLIRSLQKEQRMSISLIVLHLSTVAMTIFHFPNPSPISQLISTFLTYDSIVANPLRKTFVNGVRNMAKAKSQHVP